MKVSVCIMCCQRVANVLLMCCDVLVSSYEVALQDAITLGAVDWDTLVVDEGHRLKNDASKLFLSLLRLRCQHKVLLTGTPLQVSVLLMCC
jgi:SNF2 family DNA or RNA helicase